MDFGAMIAILFLGIPLILIGAAVLLARWAFAESSEFEDRYIPESRASMIFRSFIRWLRKPVPKMFYRRDTRGRFRKVWRG